MKMLRKVLIGIILVASCLSLQAQKASRLDVKRAEKFFNEFNFTAAVKLYEKMVDKDSTFNYAKLQLAECYRNMNEPEEAERWYAQVVEDASITQPVHKLYYAQALMSNQKYEDARIWIERYRQEVEDDERSDFMIRGIENIESFFQDSALFVIYPFKYNSEASDFSPAYYKDGLVFSSGRSGFKTVKRTHSWDDTNFLELYYTDHLSDSINKTVLFDKRLNTRFHEGPLTFYDNFEKVIFTRNNYNGRLKKADDETIHLQLYLSERRNASEEFSKPRPFPYNNDEYSLGHPSIDASESVLYFASDMPGGFGGVDIYKSEYINGLWSTPENMGPGINTAGNEMFPYIKDSVLYFSSNGHYGLGGLDLFRIDLRDSAQTVNNLGYPMNSNRDDFGIIFKEGTETGFFSSNRSGGLGRDDIYHFEILKPKKVFVRGVVVDARSGLPLDSANVILSEGDSTITEFTTGADGAFEYELDWDARYKLQASRVDWTSFTDSVETFNEIIDKEFLTLPIEQLLIAKGQLNDDEGNPVDNALLTFTNTDTGQTDSVSTNEEGILYYIAQPNSRYDVFLDKPGYFNYRTTLETGPEPGGDIPLDLVMEKIVIGKAIRIDNIYFDLNKSEIRADAAIELDKIVQMMTDNPTVKIELSSHTDSRGSDPYNLALSDRRARSSAAYIVFRGVASDRIVGVGYGETQLVNGCTNGVRCEDEEHQLNRRTEFKVVAF